MARRIVRPHQVVVSYLKNPAEYGKKSTKSRKSKLSARDKCEIFRNASNSMKSLKQIKQELNLDVSRETVRQVLVKSSHIKKTKKGESSKLESFSH